MVFRSSSEEETFLFAPEDTFFNQVYRETMEGNPNTYIESEGKAEELILQNGKKALFGTSLNFIGNDLIDTFTVKVSLTNTFCTLLFFLFSLKKR